MAYNDENWDPSRPLDDGEQSNMSGSPGETGSDPLGRQDSEPEYGSAGAYSSNEGSGSSGDYFTDQSDQNQQQEYPHSNSSETSGRRSAKKEKRTHFWPRAIAVALACIILGGGAGVGGSALYSSLNGNTNTSNNSTTVYTAPAAVSSNPVSSGSSDGIMSFEEIYNTYVNACVAISTEIVSTNLFGMTSTGAAAGSGFVLTSDGYIVTNYHVIEDATSIKVNFYDGSEYTAVLVGGEADSDVAVLKIDAQDLTPVVIGNSDELAVGQAVCTIGNPLGEMTFSQTDGIVSAVNRSVTTSDGVIMNMIQTNCTINAGNSGGPLFNPYGQVIGITSSKYSSYSTSGSSIEGIGFAIPINDVISLVSDIMENGYATGKPSVGILMNSVSTDVQRYGIPAGAEIEAVLEGSCAETAGLQVGDIVTAVDGETIEDATSLSETVEQYHAGDQITMTVYRSGETLTLTLTLDEYTPTREEAMNELQNSQSESENDADNNDNYDGNGYDWFGNFGNNGDSGNSGAFSSLI